MLLPTVHHAAARQASHLKRSLSWCRRSIPHLPVHMFSEEKYSYAIRDKLTDYFIVVTSGPKSYVDAPYGLTNSEYTCPFKPQTCAECRSTIQVWTFPLQRFVADHCDSHSSRRCHTGSSQHDHDASLPATS